MSERPVIEHRHPAPGPVDLYVEVGDGRVHVTATDTDHTAVRITGHDAQDVALELGPEQVSVVAPRRRAGFLTGDRSLVVEVEVPLGTRVVARTGSADVVLDGRAGRCQLRTGSGDVRVEELGAPATVETGSGRIEVAEAAGELRVKSGSGDVRLGHVGAAVAVSTGSGTVTVASNDGPVAVKTGSGDLDVTEARTDVTLATGSGDLRIGAATRGRVTAKGASGDVRVGIRPGTPVWTDISTVSGTVRSELPSTGAPAEGQDHVELRARTVSGDVVLTPA
ncbi:DUF4097 family beta strand repeat protein [Nocardioides sp. zg-579]|uniref:DUF4097 family beta strand repeat protein n=1 Tax=Nocardioides marmotae TaxID=2663857 RepID=A0A6I3JFA6_9ACTN|nr:DUF4097 family beta strand repeat-containing protein [Nocardioides marmotae]MCR6033148.1 DUF4097 family beta strand repeat protein [Gordonia jinghuaiqii]MTB96801.1 DUF4097 family beta strand repeat protein [Nocardioides marmotae]QKE02995.1 DUF4097 family beta strand repeat protein [Nocardioides marmotae]